MTRIRLLFAVIAATLAMGMVVPPTHAGELLEWKPMPLPVREHTPGKERSSLPGNVVSHDLGSGETVYRLDRPVAAGSAAPLGSGDFRPGHQGLLAPASDSRGGGPEGNFGPNGPTPDPSNFPTSTHVRLAMRFIDTSGDTINYMCSGTLISPRHVVTAAHCVYARDPDGLEIHDWAISVQVVPAFDNFTAPFGDSWAVTSHAWSGYIDYGDFDHDVALIDLDRPVGALSGWRGYGYWNDCDFFENGAWERHGYPAEDGFDGLTMQSDFGHYDGCDAIGNNWYGNEVWHYRPGIGGTSGSGAVKNGSVWAVRSNTTWDLFSGWDGFDTRLTEGKFNDIVGWIAEDTPATADLSPLTLNLSHTDRNAGEYLSTSWLLVYNHADGAFSGNVTGTAYLSTDNIITPSDTPLGTFSTSKTLDSFGGDWVGLPGWQIPVGTPSGQYFVGVILSSPDANSGNNTSYAWDVEPLAVGCTAGTAPVQLSPADDARCVSTPTTLSWSAEPGAVSYRLKVYTGGLEQTVPLLGTSFTMNLQPGKRYTWTVQAFFDCDGETIPGEVSQTQVFWTGAPVPGPVTPLTPPDASACVPGNADLDWEVSGGSDYYSYDVWIGYDCVTPITIHNVQPSYHVFSGLLPGVEYFWKVRGRNSCDQVGPWSSCGSFITRPSMLPAPSLVGPADEATCEPTSGQTLSWNPVSGALQYRISFGPSGCFNDADSTWIVNNATTSVALPTLLDATTYHWSVIPLDGCGQEGISSPCREFTTAIAVPVVTGAFSPDDGGCARSNLALSWDSVPGADLYRVQIHDSCAFPKFSEIHDVAGTFVVLTGQPTGARTWRMRARSACGEWGPWTACRSFTVDETLPGAPQRLASTSHTPGAWSNINDIDFSWSPPSGEPCGSGYSVSMTTNPTSIPDHYRDIASSPDPVLHTETSVGDASALWFHVRSIDAAGNLGSTAAHAGPYRIDTVGPSASIDFPVGFDTFSPGQQISIQWTVTDALSGPTTVDIEYTDDDGDTFSPVATVPATEGAHPWTVPGTEGTSNMFRIFAHDAAGNTTEEWMSRPFTIASQTSVGTGGTPGTVALAPGSPNPFRAATTVTFSLPEESRVRLVIYDAGGREIRRFHDGAMLPAGHHRVLWDGANTRGQDVGAGVYFVRLEAAGERQTRRLLRIR